jgi:hypothetical protein
MFASLRVLLVAALEDVCCKPMKRFLYLITFAIDEAAHAVNFLRVFNAYREPLH